MGSRSICIRNLRRLDCCESGGVSSVKCCLSEGVKWKSCAMAHSCDELSVFQAALLTVGVNPSSGDGAYCENWQVHERPHGYEAAKTAISNALRSGLIAGRVVPVYEYDINGNPCMPIEDSVDVKTSGVEVDSLRAWLATRGLKTGFFFPTATDAPDYLDSKNPRYAPKLAAAVRAWQAVTDPGKKSPKSALDRWLREHAAQFGLADEDGMPINQAVEDCSKVANWNQVGGAPKTPSA